MLGAFFIDDGQRGKERSFEDESERALERSLLTEVSVNVSVLHSHRNVLDRRNWSIFIDGDEHTQKSVRSLQMRERRRK